MEFDLAAMTPRDAYRLMISAVVPRPIALVTTLGRDGVVNAAPFSFFNAISFDPCMIVLGVEARPDRSFKDTARNIRDSGEFVVNLVSDAIAEAMNRCSLELPHGVGELATAGLTATPSARVAPPRIAESPAALECRRYVTLELGNVREIVVGLVLHIHLADAVIDAATGTADHQALDLVGRMGGTSYARTRDWFPMARPERPADVSGKR